MYVLRTHNSISFLEKVLSRIEKVLTTFPISNNFFSKTDLLTYALKAYINRTFLNFASFENALTQEDDKNSGFNGL